MGRRKRKTKGNGSLGNIPNRGVIHPEAESALRTIKSHPAVDRINGLPRSLGNGAFEILFNTMVSMSTKAKMKGESETGVRAFEPVIMRFPSSYPFKALKILLRPDFNKRLPHINPLVGPDTTGYVLPCVYDGPLDDLLHQECDGLSEILNELSEWLGKAAINDLIDPNQGWEPIRRDEAFGWAVYDLSGLRTLVKDEKDVSAFQCWFPLLKKDPCGAPFFVGGIDHRRSKDITPRLIQETFSDIGGPMGRLAGYLCLLVWPDSVSISDRYLPEGSFDLHSLLNSAENYGCHEPLKDAFLSLGWAIKEAKWNRSVFPIVVILCARRPYPLIGEGGSGSSFEMIPYMVMCHVADSSSGLSEAAIKFREDSPVFPLGHRHTVNAKLLKRMSGGTDEIDNGPIVHIGCGSVGSKIAVHLARSGLGPFKLIDKGAFSPHNVARHALLPVPELPGQPKAVLLADQIRLLRTNAEPHTDDIVTLCQQTDLKTIFPENSRLIIETTGSMAVREMLVSIPPRKLPGRLLHCALYQSGKVGLMALEGDRRNPNVSDLVVRHRDMGVDYPEIASSFQTPSDSIVRQGVGLGCGSHTMVMPDTRISLYSAGMAERARQVLAGKISQNGELWVGTLAENELQVSWKRIEMGQTRVLKVEEKNVWEIRILDEAVKQMTKEVKKYPEIETGGVLIGRISLLRRCLTISRVIEAPSDSKRSQSLFVLGIEGLRTKVEEIQKKSGGFLNYVGTWHSHPNGGGPSQLDRTSLEQMKNHRFGAPAVGVIWMPTGFHALLDEGKLS